MATRSHTLHRFLPLLAAVAAAACTATMDVPPGFLRLEEDWDLRAVTSDDARLRIRGFDDANAASVEFWGEVLANDFAQRGYVAVGKGEVADGNGRPGRWFEWTADVHGERVGYLVAIWVDRHRVTVAEFAARSEVYAQHADAVRAALRTVRA